MPNIKIQFQYHKSYLIQTIMMLALSSNAVDKNWYEYLSCVQYFKFDFGFINFKYLNKLDYWMESHSQLYNSKLFCEKALLFYLKFINPYIYNKLFWWQTYWIN